MTDWLDAQDLARLVGPGEAVAAVRQVLLDGFDPEEDLPRVLLPVRHGQYLLMAAEIGGFCGVKVATVTPDNPEAGRPRIQGSYLLHDAVTHQLLAIMDGTTLTALRTPAVSVAAVTQALHRRCPDGARVVVFGAGPQAVEHVRTLAAVVPVLDSTMIVRSPDRADPGRRALLANGIPTRVSTADAAAEHLRAADVVVTATTATTPVLKRADVRAAAIVIAVGSHAPDGRELAGDLVGDATVVVESRTSAQRECGDVVLAMEEGLLGADDLVGIGRAVRTGDWIDPDRPVVFKSSGMSWEDLAVAAAAYQAARADGMPSRVGRRER